MSDRELTLKQQAFLFALESTSDIKEAAAAADISVDHAYKLSVSLSDEIQERAKQKLAVASLRAASTQVELLDADLTTEKGELRLKAAEQVLDRSGVTKHTNIEVSIEATDGLFLIPGKTPVPANPETFPGNTEGDPGLSPGNTQDIPGNT